METSEQIMDVLFRRVWEIVEREEKTFEEGGNMIDLVTLQDQAEVLCHTLATLPPEDAQRYQQQLAELIESLSRFASALELRKDAIGEQLSGLSHQARAHNAYQTVSAVVSRTNDNDAEDE